MSTDKSAAAMKASEELRKIAEKWGWFVKAISIDMTQFELNKDTEQFISDLTALISENYYPKEFTNYCIKNVDYCRDMGKEWYQIMASGILILKTLDDVYNYWKENEQ